MNIDLYHKGPSNVCCPFLVIYMYLKNDGKAFCVLLSEHSSDGSPAGCVDRPRG